MRTQGITKRKAKRLLPKLLKRFNKRNEKVAVVRKRDAHDPRLPENRLAKIRAAQQAAAKEAAAARLAALAKQASEATLKAKDTETTGTNQPEINGVSPVSQADN